MVLAVTVYGPLATIELLNMWSPEVDVSVLGHLKSFRFFFEREKSKAVACLQHDVERIDILVCDSALEYKHTIETLRSIILGQFYFAFENPASSDACTHLLNLIYGIAKILDATTMGGDDADDDDGGGGELRYAQEQYAASLEFWNMERQQDVMSIIDVLVEISEMLGKMMAQNSQNKKSSSTREKTHPNPFPNPGDSNIGMRPPVVQTYIRSVLLHVKVKPSVPEAVMYEDDVKREKNETLDSSARVIDCLCDNTQKYYESLHIAHGEAPISQIEIPSLTRGLFIQADFQPSPVSTTSLVTLVVFAVLMSQVYDHHIYQYLSRCENQHASVNYILNLLPASWITSLLSDEGNCFTENKDDYEAFVNTNNKQCSLSEDPVERQRLQKAAQTASISSIRNSPSSSSSSSSSSRYFDNAGNEQNP